MNSSAFDIKDWLADESSLSLTFATDLFIGREPSNPDNCVTIFDTTSIPADLSMDLNTDPYIKNSCQIRIRNNDYIVAHETATEIFELLHNKGNENQNGTKYTVIQCSYPTVLDWDDNERVRVIINVEIQKRKQ